MTAKRQRPALGRGLSHMRIVGGWSDAGRRADFDRTLTAAVADTAPSSSPARAADIAPSSSPSAAPGDGWTRAATARAAWMARQSARAELEALRESVAALERQLRSVRADFAIERADWERERAGFERRMQAAMKRARADAHATAKHGGRLTSILDWS